MTLNFIDELQLEKHDQTVDVENCPHCCSIGDNYGLSCRHCHKQLLGYGFGGLFGANITEPRTCIHDYKMDLIDGDDDTEYCRFCEDSRLIQVVSEEIN